MHISGAAINFSAVVITTAGLPHAGATPRAGREKLTTWTRINQIAQF